MELIDISEKRAAVAAGRDPGSSLAFRAGRPVIPPPSLEVTAALEAGVKSRRLLFPENAPARTVEVWQAPVIKDRVVGQAIWERLKLLDDVMRPASRGELMSRVLVLLSHYRQSSNAEQVEQGVADDWAEDLGDFPIWAVNEAARQWRRTKKFKPQVSEMIEFCAQACQGVSVERGRLRAIVDAASVTRNSLAADI